MANQKQEDGDHVRRRSLEHHFSQFIQNFNASSLISAHFTSLKGVQLNGWQLFGKPKYQYEIYLLCNVNPGTVSKRHKLINSLDSILRVLVKSWQMIQPALRLDLVRDVVLIRTWGNVYFTLFFTNVNSLTLLICHGTED